MVSGINYLILVEHCLFIIITLFTIGVLVIRYIQTRIISILLLLGCFCLFLITGIFDLGITLVNFENLYEKEIETGLTRGFIISTLGIMSAGFFLLFIDYFENEKISTLRLILVIAAISNYFTTSLVYYELYSNTNDVSTITISAGFMNLLFMMFLPYVLLSAFFSLQKVKRFSYDQSQKKQLLYLQLANFCYYFCTILFFTVAGIVRSSEELFLLLNIFLSRGAILIGTVFIGRAYMMSDRVAFLQPQSMRRLIVINKVGLSMFSYDFTKGSQEVQANLLSGAFSALSALLSEATGASSGVTGIKFREEEIILSLTENFGVILMVDRPSKFLKTAVKNFTNEFRDTYGEAVEDLVVDMNTFKDANILVEKTFGLG